MTTILELLAFLIATALVGVVLGASFGWCLSKALRLTLVLCVSLWGTAFALTGRVAEVRTAPCATPAGYGSVSVASSQPTRWRLRTSSGWTGWLAAGARRTMPTGVYLVEIECGSASTSAAVRVESKSAVCLRISY